MRIESLYDAMAFFPDIDGFWTKPTFADSENEITARLPAHWATQWSSQSVELLTQLARAQALQGHLPRAKATLDQAQQMISSSKQKFEPRIEIRWHLENGRVHGLGMNLARAHDSFVQAWTMANGHKLEFFAVDAALMLSTIRPPKFQNEWLQKALALAQSSNDPQVRLWLSQLLFLEGWHAFDFREFDRALDCFEKAMAQPGAGDEAWKLMSMQWSRARAMRAVGKVEQALASQQMLLTDMSLVGNIDGHVYLEIAECQQLLNQTELARGNFELAYGELSAPGWYADNRGDELKRMKYLYQKK